MSVPYSRTSQQGENLFREPERQPNFIQINYLCFHSYTDLHRVLRLCSGILLRPTKSKLCVSIAIYLYTWTISSKNTTKLAYIYLTYLTMTVHKGINSRLITSWDPTHSCCNPILKVNRIYSTIVPYLSTHFQMTRRK